MKWRRAAERGSAGTGWLAGRPVRPPGAPSASTPTGEVNCPGSGRNPPRSTMVLGTARTWLGSYLRPNFHHFGLFILISSSLSGGGTGGRDSSVRKLPDSVSYGVTPRRWLISSTIGIERGPLLR